MAISDKIAAKVNQIQQERTAKLLNPAAPTPISDELQAKAVDAVLGGNADPAWETYMRIFTSDATELSRLVPAPPNSDPDPGRRKARAYLVSNGVCGIATTGQLLNEVTTELD
ncbi:MAG TPA: hypothetical protein VF656_18955 [Pyrinomonadaceae bacterium]|jgi:hypothetical protein